MIDKEIAGFGYSAKGAADISNVYVGRYQSSKDKSSRWNTANKAYATMNPSVSGVMQNQIDIHTAFHSHLARFPDSDRLVPSGLSLPGGDMEYKRNQKGHGIKKFIILTRGHNPIEY